MTQINLSMTQTHRHGEQICDCQGRDGQRSEGLGVCDQQMQTMMYRMDKQGPTTYTGSYIHCPVINIMEKNMKKKICITEPLCYTKEINTTL